MAALLWQARSVTTLDLVGNWASVHINKVISFSHVIHSIPFLADRTIGRAFATGCRLSVCLSSVCDVLYPGETVRLS